LQGARKVAGQCLGRRQQGEDLPFPDRVLFLGGHGADPLGDDGCRLRVTGDGQVLDQGAAPPGDAECGLRLSLIQMPAGFKGIVERAQRRRNISCFPFRRANHPQDIDIIRFSVR
jgi:hypothetical protein